MYAKYSMCSKLQARPEQNAQSSTKIINGLVHYMKSSTHFYIYIAPYFVTNKISATVIPKCLNLVDRITLNNFRNINGT